MLPSTSSTPNQRNADRRPRAALPKARHRVQFCELAVVVILATAAAVAGYSGQWLTASLLAVGLTVALYLAVCSQQTRNRRDLLHNWIQRLSMGDYDYTVRPTGDDEIAKTCLALERLRLASMRGDEMNLVQSLSEQLQHKNNALETALRDLRTTQEQVISQQKLAQLGIVASGVAHELRNPMNIIQNFTEIAQSAGANIQQHIQQHNPAEGEHPLQEDADDITESMRHVRNGAVKMDAIIERMLDLNRSTTDSAFQNTNLPQLINDQLEVALHYHDLTPDRLNIAVNTDFDPQCAYINANGQDIAQAIYNIVSNSLTSLLARSATNPKHQPRLDISTSRQQQSARIVITDNGTGMNEATREQVFVPFFTTKPPTGGVNLGLGMSIVHDIVSKHAGDISIDSKPDSHTTVTINLPQDALQGALDLS